MLYLLTLLSLLWFAAPAQAATLINEDFNVADMAALVATHGWVYTDEGSANRMTIVQKTGHDGVVSGVLRRQYDCHPTFLPAQCGDSAGTNSKIGRPITPASTHIWGRVMVRYERFNLAYSSGFLDPAGVIASGKMHYLNPGGADPISAIVGFFYFGTAANNWGVGTQRPSGFTVDCPPPGGALQQTCTSPPNLSSSVLPIRASASDQPTSWQCMEYELDMGTATTNGIQRVWVDGVAILDSPIQWINATYANSAFRSLQLYRQGGMNYLMFEDKFVLSNSARVGCPGGGGGGPAPDTSPPTAPVITVQ